MTKEGLPELISRRRRELGTSGRPLAREQLSARARRAGFEISQSYIRKLEGGESVPTLTMVDAIAAAIQVSSEEILRAAGLTAAKTAEAEATEVGRLEALKERVLALPPDERERYLRTMETLLGVR